MDPYTELSRKLMAEQLDALLETARALGQDEAEFLRDYIRNLESSISDARETLAAIEGTRGGPVQ